MSHDNLQHNAKKIKVLIKVIIALLFPNSKLVLCQIFSYDFPKIRNLPKIFLRSFENVTPGDHSTGKLWKGEVKKYLRSAVKNCGNLSFFNSITDDAFCKNLNFTAVFSVFFIIVLFVVCC